MTTLNPKVLFKFDYFNYTNHPKSAEITLFKILMSNFASFKDALTFLETLIEATTCDYGIIKTFYDMEEHDEEDKIEDDIIDDPTSKTLPTSAVLECKNIGDFINLLKKHKSREIVKKFAALRQYAIKMENYSDAMRSITNCMAANTFFTIRNKWEYPVLNLENELFLELLRKVRFAKIDQHKNGSILRYIHNLMNESTKHRVSDTQVERNYHHKMIGIKTDDDIAVLIEESRKKRFEELPNGLFFNFVAIPSFKTTYSVTGMRIWDSINADSRVKYMKCLSL